MTEELILMPKSLTAENGAKSLLIGEFSETVIMRCEECDGSGVTFYDGCEEICEECTGAGDYSLKVPIEWTTIKDIYAKCAEYFQNKLEKESEK